MKRLVAGSLLAASLVLAPRLAFAQNAREVKIRKDIERFATKTDWIYNDIDKAYRAAKQANKPIMAVLRCIPCEECVKLDDDVIDDNQALAPLMDNFVRLRLTSTNGLDLTTFQYDTDQSFAVLFLNADKVVYGRFGTRSHRTEWTTDVSVKGLARAMEGALALHKRYPSNREELLAKSKQPTEFSTPEQFPRLREKPGSLDWQGPNFAPVAAKKCIHCHEISEARMDLHWNRPGPIPDNILYPYPHPKSVGLILDPDYRARVADLQEGSAAATAGLRPGDELLRMNNQPLISMADVQWVLHHLPSEGGGVELLVRRDGQLIRSTLALKPGWRSVDDTSWRTGHWILRRSMLGGMKLANDAEPGQPSQLYVEYLGNGGPHGVAHRAGAKKGDLILAIDGRPGFKRETDVFDYINRNKKPGDQVQLTLSRNGKQVEVRYKIQ